MCDKKDTIIFPEKKHWELVQLKLEQWGADPRTAVWRMVDDEAFYYGLLLKFVQKREWLPLETALERCQYDDAFKIAHDLKGVTATLSLTPLWHAVSRIVEDLRGDPRPELDEDMLAFKLELLQLQKIIRQP